MGGLGTTTIAYQYDDLYRLTGAAYTGAITATFTYDYDPVGNMTAFTETVDSVATVVARTFDAANRLQTALDLEEGTTSYIYDDSGNLTDIYPPGSDAQNPLGVLHYGYNQRNLLITHTTYVSGTGWVLQAEYVYDDGNDRLQQVDYTSTTPVTTTYATDVIGLTQVLVAGDGTGQVYNLFGLDLIEQDDDSAVRTLLVDGLGSVRLEMVGGVVETVTTYSPYGEVLEQTGTSGTVYGFTGEQEDSATGLLYLRARYYNSALKMFMSRDPWEGTGWRPGTLNYYLYTTNNPINLIDLTGRRPCSSTSESSCGNNSLPDWWTSGIRRLYVAGYGVFDVEHIERGYRSAEFFMTQTKAALARGGGEFDTPALSIGGFLRSNYEANYWVSGNVTPEQLEGVVYGMYTDFELGYEEFQAGRIDFISVFAPEDLPSDHIEFWAYVNDKSQDEIPHILEKLGEVTPWYGPSLLMDIMTTGSPYGTGISILCFPRNREFLPMVDNEYYHGLGTYEVRWQNKPWPPWLEITRVQSGPDTWERVD